MKNLNALLVILLAQPLFALTGVVESKVLGTKTVHLDLAAVRVIPAAVSVEVTADHDSQDLSCSQFLLFPNMAQALLSMEGQTAQQSMSLIVSVSNERITDQSECKTANVPLTGPTAASLVKVLDSQFLISQNHEGDVLTQTYLVLASASQVLTVDLANVTETHYTLKNLKLNSAIPMNFYVIKTSQASVSYLEHGTVTFQ